MAKIRIYELARELGIDNKIVIAKAEELGFSGKTSHSNTLDGSEADAIRRAIIRQAIGSSPESRVVKSLVDSSTGEKTTLVESRKGNIIRRRKRAGEESAPQIDEQESVEQESDSEALNAASSASVEEHSLSGNAAQQLAYEEEPEVEVRAEDIQEPESQESGEEMVAETVAEDTPEQEKKAGPRVLGKIELPVQKQKPVKKPAPAATTSAVVYVDDEEDESEDRDGKRKGAKAAGQKKRGKKREFSRTDLLDYDGRAPRRTKKGGKKGQEAEDDAEQLDEQELAEKTATKASKRVVRMDQAITVGDFAQQMSLKASEVIAKLIELGVLATINQPLDQDTATIVAEEFGFQVEFTGFDETEILGDLIQDQEGALVERPPVVTVMGHVDHGKTSLLDSIRSASVAAKEHGGITQHIGAYSVELSDGRKITFLDTPGHAAFTSMRARGANITDIVILVVAADDGVMPQTEEAINHARAAGVPIVVAVNKMDKAGANPDRVKQQLSEKGLQPEEWGGDTMFYPVSALKGDGIQGLLEGVLLQAELKELRANPDRGAIGTIVEARQEKGRGTVATVLVQKGTLRLGDVFVCGSEFGRVRSMLDYRGQKLEQAGPSTPVEISGLSNVPEAGDDFVVVESETKARQVANHRAERRRAKEQAELAGGPISLEEFARRTKLNAAAELNLIVKADVHGSLEAVKEAVTKLSGEKVIVKVIHGGVGGINESDVQLAIASSAIILGFNVRAEPRAMAEAESLGVDIRFYRVIYELIDEVKSAMAGLLAPIKKEVHLGRAEVRDTFSVPKIGTVAGCYILDGVVKRGCHLRLLRDSTVVHEGRMLNLRRFKDDVKEVQTGYECGISIAGFNDLKPGDLIEVYEIKEEAATLEGN